MPIDIYYSRSKKRRKLKRKENLMSETTKKTVLINRSWDGESSLKIETTSKSLIINSHHIRNCEDDNRVEYYRLNNQTVWTALKKFDDDVKSGKFLINENIDFLLHEIENVKPYRRV